MRLSALLFAATLQAATYYVSTSGSSGNPGTIASPWSRPHVAAENNPAGLACGDVVLFRGGTYDGPVRWYGAYNCTESTRVTFMNYCGETVVFDNSTNAALPGSSVPSANITTDSTSKWMWFRRNPCGSGEFQITNSSTDRDFTAAQWMLCYPSCVATGIQPLGDNNRFTGLVFWNTGTGIASQAASCGDVYEELWIANTGYQNTEEGLSAGEPIYAANEAPGTCSQEKKFRNIVAFGGFFYSQFNGSTGSYQKFLSLKNSLLLSSGHNAFDAATSALLVGGIGGAVVEDIVLDNNFLVNLVAESRNDTLRFYSTGTSVWTLARSSITNNYVRTLASGGGEALSLSRTPSEFHEQGNRFFGPTENGSAAGFFPKSAFSAGADASTFVVERRNEVDTHRGYLVVNNGPNAATVTWTPSCKSGTVTLTEGMNFLTGSPQHTFDCDGQPKSITMAYGGAIMQPPEYSNPNVHTGTTFRFFRLDYSDSTALDNAIRITDRTGSTQTNRPFTVARVFVEGEICDYPQPWTNDAPIATWQSDNINRWPASAACPAGSVKRADISFRATVPANGTLTVDFRNNANPCSSGNRAACDAAGLDQAGMLAFNGGTWTLTNTNTANPQGATTARTTNFRTALSGGLWRYYLRGPVVTRVLVEDASTSLTLDHGWKEDRVVRLTGTLGTTATDIPVEHVAEFSGLSRPFTIEIDGEQIQICFVGASSLTVGTTNGGSSACATTAGRGVNGTTAASHSQNLYGNFIRPVSTMWLTAAPGASGTSITVNDGSSINAATLIQVGSETIRICNRSGNVLTAGIAAWPCSADVKGRGWHGTVAAFSSSNSWLSGTMVRVLTGLSSRWVDAPHDRYKSIHPEAMLTFYVGWAGVGQAVSISNYWTTRMQDQIFDVAVSNSGGSLYSATALKMVPRTRKRLPLWSVADSQYWDGTAPGEVRIDHNAAYWKAAGVIPLDPDVVLSAQGVTEELSTATATSGTPEPGWDQAHNNRCEETLAKLEDQTSTAMWTFGSHVKGLDISGAARGRGLIYGVAARAIASWKSSVANAHRINEVALSMGSCAGNIPIHYREGATGLNYCAAGGYAANPTDTSCTGGNLSTNAFGYPISIDARPSIVPNNQINTASGERITPVGYVTTNNFGVENGTYQGWTSHMPALAWVPYLMTGDPFLKDELIYLAHAMVASASEFPDYFQTSAPGTRAHQRHRSLGWLAMSNGSRTRAWPLRDLSQGAWAADDGSPIKQLLTSKILRNIGIDEGRYGVTDGFFHSPCPVPATPDDNSPWCIGRYKANNANLTEVYSVELPAGALCLGNTDCQRTYYEASTWMDGYLYLAMAHSENLGFSQWGTVRRRIAKGFVDRLTHSDYNMFLIGTYREPAMPCLPEGTPQVGGCAGQTYTNGDRVGFSSFAALKAAHLSANQSLTSFSGSTESDYLGGTMQAVFAASSTIPDTDGAQAGGLRAYERLKGVIKYQDYRKLPMWAMTPRQRVTVTARSGDTALHLSGRTTTAAPCRVAVAPNLPASSDDSADALATMSGREWSYVATGLAASTTYRVRVTCGTGRVFTSATTTAAAGSATTATVSAGIPSANNIEVQYGAGLASSVSGACSAGLCSASVPATTGRALEYRFRGRDAGNVAITGWSSTHRIIP